MKLVTIMRGIPGSGKSTYTKQFPNAEICSADHYFTKDGTYQFDPTRLGEAHRFCQEKFLRMLRSGAIDHIIVDNTNTRLWEMVFYIQRAHAHRYVVEIVEVACDPEIAAARNTHQVPLESVKRMAIRFEPLEHAAGLAVKRISGTAA